MNPLLILAVLGLGGYAVMKASSSDPKSEAPADANSLLATVLAPSMTDVAQLTQFMNVFLAAGPNQPKQSSKTRLSLYALATALKAQMLKKGAQPNALELLAIAYTPSSWSDKSEAPADTKRACDDGLNSTMTSVPALNTYIAAISQATTNQQLTTAQKTRMVAYLLALKSKAMMLTAGADFGGIYTAIANMPLGKVPTITANSILASA